MSICFFVRSLVRFEVVRFKVVSLLAFKLHVSTFVHFCMCFVCDVYLGFFSVCACICMSKCGCECVDVVVVLYV